MKTNNYVLKRNPIFRILLPYFYWVSPLNQWYPFPKEYFDKSIFFLALILIGILINLSYNYKTRILLPGLMLVILFVLGWKSPNQSEGQLLEEGKVEEIVMEIESVSKSKFYTNYTVQTKFLK
ncbi:MAG: hypothetical protein R2784_08350 [Saprospiraceae bacterium]